MYSTSKRTILIFSVAILITMLFSVNTYAARKSKVNNVTYYHPPTYKLNLHKLYHGVDVSAWQGKINWKKAKRAGIDFAIIRCGYTSLDYFKFHQDSWFTTNYKNAKNAGVSVGLYYYACATTKKEARKEANYVISILKNNKVRAELPVVMDYEFGPGRANNRYNNLVKKYGKKYARRVFTNAAKAFMNRIKAAGYETMFYTYRALMDPSVSAGYRFNMSQINGDEQYRFWLAQYTKTNSYASSMEIWQFTSTGKVKGMKGNIDRNFWYYPLKGVKTKDGTTSIRKCKITLAKKKVKYDEELQKPKVTVRYKGKKLKLNTDYTLSYMDNIGVGPAMVLIHGKGKYSNEAHRTFTIMRDPNLVLKPAVPSGVTYKMDVKNRKITFTWNSSQNATRYRIKYKVNGANKWTVKVVKKRKFVLEDLKLRSFVKFTVRAENVGKKKTKVSKYAIYKHPYLRKMSSKATIIKGDRMRVTWDALKDKNGKVEYQVINDCVTIFKNVYNTKKTRYIIQGDHRYCYEVYARPVLKHGNDTYYGADPKERAHLFLITGVIKKLTPKKNGFTAKYNYAKGIGNPRYAIYYSTNSRLNNADRKTRAQKYTKCTVKGLKAGRTYYVAMQPYKYLEGNLYLGVRGKAKSVKTK